MTPTREPHNPGGATVCQVANCGRPAGNYPCLCQEHERRLDSYNRQVLAHAYYSWSEGTMSLRERRGEEKKVIAWLVRNHLDF